MLHCVNLYDAHLYMNGFSYSHHVTLCNIVLHCMMPTCTWMGSAAVSPT